MARNEDMLEIELQGSNWLEIRDKALRYGENFFMIPSESLDVLPFVATPGEGFTSHESSEPIRVVYFATVVVSPR